MASAAEAVEQAAREAFPNADIEAVMALLNTYGVAPHENERERVQLTIIRICQGDVDRLPYQLEVAKIDYRDILVFANRPIPTATEEAKKLAEMQSRLLQQLNPSAAKGKT